MAQSILEIDPKVSGSASISGQTQLDNGNLLRNRLPSIIIDYALTGANRPVKSRSSILCRDKNMKYEVGIPGKATVAIDPTNHNHIKFFDGLRGLLCLWIFIYHAENMIGLNSRLIPPGQPAVDIFMFISGFVMAHTLSIGNQSKNILSVDNMTIFYLKRIIRIVPVYYLVLLFAIVFFASFLQFAREAAAAFPPAWVADLHNDPSIIAITPTNILLHMTFLFGLNPHYASNMPIPDWSLTLEMQFYAVVPFLLMAMRKYGLTLPIAALAILNFLALKYIGLYLWPKIGGLWPQPSMLLFKIDCFIAGMLIALYFVDDRFSKTEIFCWLLVLVYLEASFIFAAVAASCFALLASLRVSGDLFTRSTQLMKAALQSKPIVFFGEISYDFYLLHPLALLFVVHMLLKTQWYAAEPAAIRFGMLVGLSAIIVIPAAYLIHIVVERPFQKTARPICAWVLARKSDWQRKTMAMRPTTLRIDPGA